MDLIREINESVTQSSNVVMLIEQFEMDLAHGREITNENLMGVLDRIKHSVTKRFLSDAEKQSIARVLTALTWIKHNVDDPQKGEKLRDLIDSPMVGEKDFVAAVEKLSPGALKKMGPQAFMQSIFQDIGQGGDKVRAAVQDVSTLKAQDFDKATSREQVRRQVPVARQ